MIFILPNFFGLDGVWFAQPTADIVSALITGIVLIKEIRKYSVDEEYELSEKVKVSVL
jgi:Na+-driven multidrug efflux pump